MASYFSDRSLRMVKLPIDEVQKVQKRRQRSSLLFWGTELIQFHAALQDDLKKWRNIRTDTWRNGRFRSSRLHHTNPPPSKMDVLPKTFLQIILAVKWLVRHSSTVHTSPKEQRRPLPSLLFYSSSIQLPRGEEHGESPYKVSIHFRLKLVHLNKLKHCIAYKYLRWLSHDLGYKVCCMLVSYDHRIINYRIEKSIVGHNGS